MRLDTMPVPTASSVPSGTYQGQASRPTGASQLEAADVGEA